MLVLMRALRARGHAVELVCAGPPAGAERHLEGEAMARGLAPVATLAPHRSAWRRGDGAIVRALAQRLSGGAGGEPFDLVHCWHSRDHVLAARALGRDRPWPGAARGATRIVRSYARAETIRAWPWQRWLFGSACDGLLCPSVASAQANRGLSSGRPCAGLPGAVELAALPAPDAEERARARADALSALALPADALLLGVVARMQPHRRFDLLLAALAKLVVAHPEARLVVLGRGTRAESLVAAPARALGLARHVALAGHRRADYVRLLSAMDVVTYLVPGSDGGCRALLEAASLGVPLVGSGRGAIPELVRDGETGLVVDEDPDALAAAWAALLEDPARRRALGDAARRDAEVRFAPARLAADVEAFYAAVLRSAPTSSR